MWRLQRAMTFKRVNLVSGVALAFTIALSGCQKAPRTPQDLVFPGANVLLITLDTTRADRIGAYGYERAETPRLDQLAEDGVLFEQAITPTAFTLPSHSSIMTGLYPPFHGVRLNGGVALADVHVTLAERLAASGYRCGAVVGAFVLDQRWGLSQGFEHYEDDIDRAADQPLDLAGVQRPADRIVDTALEWLEREDGRPFLAWLHFYDPHIPYEPPEPYATRFSDRGPGGLYDGEIAFTDDQVGRVFDWLDKRGLGENTIVVVVGDHGEGLGDHDERQHGYFIYDATVHVPLMFKIPGSELEGIRVPAQVRTIDILPTVLGLVGIKAPVPIHGQSLVPLMLDPKSPGPEYAYSESMAVYLHYGWSALYSVRTSDDKFIDAPRAELYDITADPGENQNLFARDRRRADELRSVLAHLREEIERGAPQTQDADLDEETRDMLAALGYVGGATAAPESGNLADPKDKVHLFDSIGYASTLMLEDDFEEAISVLKLVLGDDPEIPQATLMLAAAYREANQIDEGKAILDDYLRENPDSTRALTLMAKILSDEGRDEEVLALAKRVLAEDDRSTEAYALMAGVYMKHNDHRRALPLLEKAVEIQPKLTRNRLNLAAAYIGVGRLAEAETVLNAIQAEYPDGPRVNYHLGLLYEEQGRTAEARDAYAKELELHPKSVMPRFNLGNLEFRLGNVEAAEREMRILIEEVPEIPKPHLLLARILLQQERDLDEVERLAKAGLERTEADDLKVLGYYLLADVYSRQCRQAELQQVLEKAQYYRSRIEGTGG
jgi:arylsulfatase A-like enzyme/predicted Zn-dependent protease